MNDGRNLHLMRVAATGRTVSGGDVIARRGLRVVVKIFDCLDDAEDTDLLNPLAVSLRGGGGWSTDLLGVKRLPTTNRENGSGSGDDEAKSRTSSG